MDTGIEDAAKAIAELIYRSPFRKYAKTFLRIEDEKGRLVPFELNEAQLIVDEEVERQLALGRPVRILILKGRQQGMSTYCQGRVARRVLTRQGTKAHTVGHALSSVNGLYDKMSRFLKELYCDIPSPMMKALGLERPAVEAGGERGRRMTFSDPLRTSYRCDSAHDPDSVGRGLTVQVAHLTETPQWKKSDETMQSILAAIPDDPDTEVYVENTAKGASGWFYETWVSSMRQVSEGIEPEFVPIFVPWFKTKRYARKKRQGEPGLDLKERAFQKEHNLSVEQVLWYRDQRRKYGRNVTEEYPSTWQEAFLSSGRPFFDPELMQSYYRPQRRKPDTRGVFRIYNAPSGGKRAQFTVDEHGEINVFHRPTVGNRYVIGADFASGRSKDYSAAVVLDIDNLEVVATYRSKELPDSVLDNVVLLARLYEDAFIVPERSGIGQTLVDRLVNDFKYPHVYREHDPTSVKFHGGARYGFATSNGTKTFLMEELAHFVHTKQLEIPDYRILQEMETLVYSDDKGRVIEAAQGQNDDMVMALAFAVRGISRAPVSRKLAKNIKPYSGGIISARTGY